MTSEEDEQESEPEEICRITQINKIQPDENDHYGIELKINETKQKFTIDNSSLVTIMPNTPKLLKTENIKPIKARYQDVNKNEIKIPGENTGGRRTRRNKNQTPPTNHQTKG